MTDTVKEPKDTKKAQALKIVKENNASKTTKELVSLIMDNVKGKMTQLGARTYVYNCRKELGLEAKPREKKAAKKATPATPKKSTKKAGETKTPRKRSKTAEKKDPASDSAKDRKAAHIAAAGE